MLANLLFAAAVPAEMCGLFAVWNWSRRSASLRWLVLGIASLALLVSLMFVNFPDFQHQACLSLSATYLLAGLAWAWLMDGLRPTDWSVGEGGIAVLGVGMLMSAIVTA